MDLTFSSEGPFSFVPICANPGNSVVLRSPKREPKKVRMKKETFIKVISVWALLHFGACTSEENNLLIGDWKGYEVMEEGEKLDINASEIQLSFINDQIYTYASTLDYKEAGKYNVQSSYLYTMDTLSAVQSGRKAVEIIQLTVDSLQLRMNDSGKERILKLLKESPSLPSTVN